MEIVDDDYVTRMAGFESDCNDGKGEPIACQRVGEFYAVVQNEHAKAAKMFSQNCDSRNFSASCFSLARLYMGGKGIEQSDNKALAYFDKACKGGHAPACYLQASMLQFPEDRMEGGERVDMSKVDRKVLLESRTEAYRLFESNCLAGDYESCFMSGNHYLSPNNPDRDPPKAAKYLQVACDRNQPKACFNLAVMYKKGDTGVPQDLKRFEELKLQTNALLATTGGAKGVQK